VDDVIRKFRREFDMRLSEPRIVARVGRETNNATAAYGSLASHVIS
jgi:hypothetical protein